MGKKNIKLIVIIILTGVLFPVIISNSSVSDFKTVTTPIDSQHNLHISSLKTKPKEKGLLSIKKVNKAINNTKQYNSLSTLAVGPGTTGFISTWNTALSVMLANNQITLPLQSNGTYNFLVLWGDGSNNTITAYNQAGVTHTYSSPGVYTVNITGTIIGWSFNGGGDALKIINISQWGNLSLGNSGYYFSGAKNLVLTTNDSPDLTGTTNFAGFFENCSAFNQSIGSWNISSVTTMQNMFMGVTLSVSNYDNILNGWSSQAVQSSVIFDAGNYSEYGSSAITARNILVNNDSWSINDAGLAIAPSPPQYLQAESSFNYVTLSWPASPSSGSNPIVSYNIYRSISNDTNSIPITNNLNYTLIGTTNALTRYFTDLSVFVGHTYVYVVQAFNSYLYSNYSGPLSITIKATAPRFPQNLQVSAGDGYVYLNWTAPFNNGGSPITNYSISRSTTKANFHLLKTVPFSTLFYNDTSVANGQTYYYLVEAINIYGSSGSPDIVTATPFGPLNIQSTTTATTATTPVNSFILGNIQIITILFSLMGMIIIGIAFYVFRGKNTEEKGDNIPYNYSTNLDQEQKILNNNKPEKYHPKSIQLCIKCNKPIYPDDNFCQNCGTPVIRI